MKINFQFVILIIAFLNLPLFPQNPGEIWVSTDKTFGGGLFIDVYGLNNFKGDDFYVWAIQDAVPPLEMEGIDKEVYKIKTYYLINRELKKYSILEMVFYDEKDNVVKSFNYKVDTQILAYKYSYPIYPNSDADFILKKSLEYLGSK